MKKRNILPSGPTDYIDRESYEPAYVQLAKILKRQIATGAYKPGDRLPSEAQLCDSYEVSPMTVRRSINLLLDQEVVSTAQGRGTFVRALELSAATFNLQDLVDLFDGETGTIVKLLDVRIVSADERVARKLGVEINESTIFLRRLLIKADAPFFYHRAYLVCDPTRPIVEAEMDVTSLHGLFACTDNTLLKRGELSITATLMNAEEAEVLKTPLPAAAFHLEHHFFDFDEQPISWGWFICRSDRLRFTTRVGIEHA